jgi:FkbM family methyltransferase
MRSASITCSTRVVAGAVGTNAGCWRTAGRLGSPAIGALKTRLKPLLLRSPRAYAAARRTYVLARYYARRPHEPDFALFGEFPERTGLFLDVGANSGLSALSFRVFNRTAPILSIEPNPTHEPDLRRLRRILRRFDYRIMAAGEENGTATLHVPLAGEVALTGEASLERAFVEEGTSVDLAPETAGRAVRIVEYEVPVRRLDDLTLDVDYIKVDVQGFELRVFRGLLETIERRRPIVLVETSLETEKIRDLLAPLGYSAWQWDRGTLRAYEGQSTVNVFLLPADAAPHA